MVSVSCSLPCLRSPLPPGIQAIAHLEYVLLSRGKLSVRVFCQHFSFQYCTVFRQHWHDLWLPCVALATLQNGTIANGHGTAENGAFFHSKSDTCAAQIYRLYVLQRLTYPATSCTRNTGSNISTNFILLPPLLPPHRLDHRLRHHHVGVSASSVLELREGLRGNTSHTAKSCHS